MGDVKQVAAPVGTAVASLMTMVGRAGEAIMGAKAAIMGARAAIMAVRAITEGREIT